MRILKSNSIFTFINGLVVDLATPLAINSAWNFGSILGILLGVQIVSGFFLAEHYTADLNLAFSSVDIIMREVSYG
jgi:ubiquinol-cytochrome c reductase cytochrome b subunit